MSPVFGIGGELDVSPVSGVEGDLGVTDHRSPRQRTEDWVTRRKARQRRRSERHARAEATPARSITIGHGHEGHDHHNTAQTRTSHQAPGLLRSFVQTLGGHRGPGGGCLGGLGGVAWKEATRAREHDGRSSEAGRCRRDSETRSRGGGDAGQGGKRPSRGGAAAGGGRPTGAMAVLGRRRGGAPSNGGQARAEGEQGAVRALAGGGGSCGGGAATAGAGGSGGREERRGGSTAAGRARPRR